MSAFNLTDDTQRTEISASKAFPVGEQVEGVKIKSAELASGDNWKAVDINYTVGGAELRDRMFLPTKGQAAPAFFEGSDKEYYEQKLKTFNTTLFHILTEFGLTEEQINEKTTADDHLEGCKKVCDVINHLATSQTFWLKVTKNKKGYSEVARSKGSMLIPFLQSMRNPTCTLRYTKFQRAQAMKETPVSGTSAGASVSNEVLEDFDAWSSAV